MTQAFFDGHNDFLLRLYRAPQNRQNLWLQENSIGHLDIQRMKKAGFAGGFFAIYMPSPVKEGDEDFEVLMENPPYDLPFPEPILPHEAQPMALSMAGHLHWMERASEGQFKICRSALELRSCIDEGVIAGIMHMEGAEAIDADLDLLPLFYAMGLRSVGPLWSRPNQFGNGAPFRFPGHPDTGDGLTDAGKDLVRLCDEMGVMIDLSHLNEKGFDDVAKLSSQPLIATHSNAHALTATPRNLTDRQLAMIKETGGLVGLNFATIFLREDGKKSADMNWDPMLAHLDYLIEKLGEEHVGFGSDFDGCTLPAPMKDVTGMPKFLDVLRAHGYDEALIEKIALSNWLNILDKVLVG